MEAQCRTGIGDGWRFHAQLFYALDPLQGQHAWDNVANSTYAMVLTSAVDCSFDQSTKLMQDYIREPSRESAFLRSEVSKPSQNQE
jgi:hypothetical protein